jgi:hypothetical protein
MKNQTEVVTPDICTLSESDLRQRMSWIAELNSSALYGYRRDGLRLELFYHAHARARIMEMIRREEDCCTPLIFAVHDDSPGILCVVIEAPVAARKAAETLFDAYHSAAMAQSACACCAGGS